MPAFCARIHPLYVVILIHPQLLDYSAQIQANLRMLNHDYSYQERVKPGAGKSNLPLFKFSPAVFTFAKCSYCINGFECLQATFTITGNISTKVCKIANLQGRFQRFTHPLILLWMLHIILPPVNFWRLKLRNDPPLGKHGWLQAYWLTSY